MIVLADLPIEPNVIIVFAMVIFAAIKALLEKAQGGKAQPPALEEEEEELYDAYAEYEAELQRQRAELEINLPAPQTPAVPPPLTIEPKPLPVVVKRTQPARPKLSAAEVAALENLQLTGRSKPRVTSSTKARVKKNLSSPTAAREALLLAEILGPPKALKVDETI